MIKFQDWDIKNRCSDKKICPKNASGILNIPHSLLPSQNHLSTLQKKRGLCLMKWPRTSLKVTFWQTATLRTTTIFENFVGIIRKKYFHFRSSSIVVCQKAVVNRTEARFGIIRYSVRFGSARFGSVQHFQEKPNRISTG